MSLEIIRNDITKVHVDAIVNAANSSLLGGGGVDGAIHRAAGPELLAECQTLGGCAAGQAKITKGYKLPAKYVIHTVGPVWNGGKSNEEKILTACYKNALALAQEHHLESIAFPLISSGAFGYPKDKALKTAVSTIGDFLLSNDMTVFLVVYDKAAFMLTEKLSASITKYIDDHYIEGQPVDHINRLQEETHMCFSYTTGVLQSAAALGINHQRILADLVKQKDETFSQMLIRLIDEKGMTDAETYKKANIDRKLFSKIRNDIDYTPSKYTAIAFAVALELNLDETKDLLLRAGFALSNSSIFDLIIAFCIENGIYNIIDINIILFDREQHLLGA